MIVACYIVLFPKLTFKASPMGSF